MMEKSPKLVELINIVNSCLLPELVVEIGDANYSSDDFNSFRKILDQNIIVVFDMLQANGNILKENNTDSINFQVQFILLLCEQSSPYSFQWHQTKNNLILKNIEKLIKKHFETILSKDQKSNKIFEFYKSKLVGPALKKNIGSLVGFLQFLEIKYNKLGKGIKQDEITFILSVGVLLQDFFDPIFKEMALKVFNILLTRTEKEHLIGMNVHNVIYEELKHDIFKYSFENIQILWNNLILCLKIRNYGYSYEKFTEVDYLIKDLLHQTGTVKSLEIWFILMNILLNLYLEFTLNTGDVKSLLVKENILLNIANFREVCCKINPKISYRWAKTILEFLISESNYLIGFSSKTGQILNIFHLCYLICILPIDLNILDDLIQIFWNKFSAILMEVIRINKSDIMIYDLVKDIFKTFIYHIELQKNMCDNLKTHYGTVFYNIMECIDDYM